MKAMDTAAAKQNDAMLPAMRFHHHTANSHVSRSGARAAYTRSHVSSDTTGFQQRRREVITKVKGDD